MYYGTLNNKNHFKDYLVPSLVSITEFHTLTDPEFDTFTDSDVILYSIMQATHQQLNTKEKELKQLGNKYREKEKAFSFSFFFVKRGHFLMTREYQWNTCKNFMEYRFFCKKIITEKVPEI